VVVFFPTLRTKSEAATMPTSLFWLSTGSLWILLVDIILAASFSEVSGSMVIRFLVMTSETFASRELRLATILLTMSLSVMIPTGKALITTIKHPKLFSAMSSAASNTVLFASMVMTSFVMISFTAGMTIMLKVCFSDKSLVVVSAIASFVVRKSCGAKSDVRENEVTFYVYTAS